MTDEERQALKVKGGVVIEEIRSGGANLEAGDVVLALISKGRTTEVRSAEQFNAILSKMDKSATVTLLVRRGDQQLFATVKLNE